MRDAHLIEINPKIMLGKPVVKGTRITVEQILEDLAVGKTFRELLEAHPRLTLDGIKAACNSLPDLLKVRRFIPWRYEIFGR